MSVNAVHLLYMLATGKSETLNGYSAGISFFTFAVVASLAPISRIPPVPFAGYIWEYHVLFVVSLVAAACLSITRATLLYSKGRMRPLLLLALTCLASSAASYLAGGFGWTLASRMAAMPSTAEVTAVFLLVTSLSTFAYAGARAFASRFPESVLLGIWRSAAGILRSQGYFTSRRLP